jgi:hypothetical protein
MSELPELQCMRSGQDQQTLPQSLHVLYTISLARHGKYRLHLKLEPVLIKDKRISYTREILL